jgi:hypothetical protein
VSRSPRLSRAQGLALVAVPSLLGGMVGASFGLRAGLAIVLGPLSGGFLRDWQSCCARNSLAILPWSLALAAVGLSVQFAVAPTSVVRNVVRWLGWMLALLAWFGGALVSDLHALE